MRIIHVAPFYTPVIGGVEEVVRKIAEYTASRGYETYVITYNRLRNSGIGSLPREEDVIRLKLNLTKFRSAHLDFGDFDGGVRGYSLV
jgi:glycosyltransferase involved in cell wall biosynthesis